MNNTKNSEENRTSELYSSACNEVKAPDELLRKVINMEKASVTRVSTVKRVAVALLALAVMAIGSNAAVYAATGTGWFGRIVVSWFGEDKEVDFVEKTDVNGTTYYEGTIQEDNGDSMTVTTSDVSALDGKNISFDGEMITVTDEAETATDDDYYDFTVEVTSTVESEE